MQKKRSCRTDWHSLGTRRCTPPMQDEPKRFSPRFYLKLRPAERLPASMQQVRQNAIVLSSNAEK